MFKFIKQAFMALLHFCITSFSGSLAKCISLKNNPCFARPTYWWKFKGTLYLSIVG